MITQRLQFHKKRVSFCRAHSLSYVVACPACQALEAAQIKHEMKVERFKATHTVIMDRSNVVERVNGIAYYANPRRQSYGAIRFAVGKIPAGYYFVDSYCLTASQKRPTHDNL